MDGCDATSQILATFQSLVPHLQTTLDKDLKLEPNPGATKRPRNDGASKGKGKKTKPEDEQTQQNRDNVLAILTKLVLRQDQEIQSLRREDTFLFFFDSNTKGGSLQVMLQAAEQWHQLAQVEPRPKPWTPLRQKLMQTLLQELLTRLTQLVEADPLSQLVRTAQASNILLADMTCPYLDWNPQQRKLVVGSRSPITLKKMILNIQELLEMFTEVSLIKAFHALPPSAQGTITPWRLQMSIRADREFLLMQSLCGSSIWVLMATSLKVHNQTRSGLAVQLAQALQPQKGRGKTKTGKA